MPNDDSSYSPIKLKAESFSGPPESVLDRIVAMLYTEPIQSLNIRNDFDMQKPQQQ
jgi:hypothetical protein